MSFVRAAARASTAAGRRAFSVGNQGAAPYQTPTIPAINAESLARNGLKFGVWGVPAVMVAGWLFWGRREELKAETKKFLGIADEE